MVPVLSVVRGHPCAEQIAALVVVLAAGGRPAEVAAEGRVSRSNWSGKSRLVRETLVAGPGAWRASALPR